MDDFIPLDDDSGLPVWVNPSCITHITHGAPMSPNHFPGAVLHFIGGTSLAMRNTPDQILDEMQRKPSNF